jgi:PPM family protein phosphatase
MSLLAHDQQPVHAAVCGRTDTGRKRADNQDNLLIADLSRSADNGGYALHAATAADAQTARLAMGPKGALLLVADGMGGAAAGGLASALAVSQVHRELMAGWAVETQSAPLTFALRLRQALESANSLIHEAARQDPSCHGMGTTATLAGVLGDTVYFAQVGDSRAYVMRGGSAVQLTRDQSVVQQLIDSGAMTEAEAENSTQASRILQALGAAPTVDVVLTQHVLRRGDIILLCSDGLSRVVRQQELAAAAAQAPDVARLCHDLIALANERGGPDNITVVAARFDGDGLADARPGEVILRAPCELPVVA